MLRCHWATRTWRLTLSCELYPVLSYVTRLESGQPERWMLCWLRTVLWKMPPLRRQHRHSTRLRGSSFTSLQAVHRGPVGVLKYIYLLFLHVSCLVACRPMTPTHLLASALINSPMWTNASHLSLNILSLNIVHVFKGENNAGAECFGKVS